MSSLGIGAGKTRLSEELLDQLLAARNQDDAPYVMITDVKLPDPEVTDG